MQRSKKIHKKSKIMIKLTKSIKTNVGVLCLVILSFLYSCEVEKIEPAKPVPDVEETDPTNQGSEEEKKPINEKITEIGTGSGNLEIKDIENQKYSIKAGTYKSINIENIKNIKIDGLGKVKINNGDIKIKNINGLTISGLTIENRSQPVIYISENADNLTLKDLVIKNITNSVISFSKNEKYDGSPQSFSENIHLINIQAENVGTLFGSQGGIKENGFYGLIKGFKLTNSKIINSPRLSNGIYLGLAEDYEISNNVINNVNTNNNEHNGIFHVLGNGKIFGNKVTNHQGNLTRAWLFSITKPGTVEIHNNIVYNSTRYGAFELQVPPKIKALSTFKPANAKVYNNTVGKLNTGEPKYFEGRLLDLYQTYGNVEIYNNLIFNLRDNILLNNMSNPKDTKIIKNSDNLYFKNQNDAVSDLTNFKSKISNIGAL